MTAINDYCKGNGFSLYYSINGQGKPIIFIHGNFNDSRIWEYQVKRFSEEYKAISYDLRGYGKSSTPETTFSHTDDLKFLIENIDVNEVTLIGSSLGGSIAIDFTLKYPNLVDKLILAAPALNGYKYPFRLSIEAMKNLYFKKTKGNEAAINKFIENPYWEYLFPSQENKTAREMVLSIVRDEKNFYSWNPNLAKPLEVNAIDCLNAIEIPALIVLSDKDKDFNIKVGNYIHKNIRNSKKVIMSNCGHLPFVERAQEFNKIVMDFISE